RRACSNGKKTLTSPELGLSVPTKATTINGQNDEKPANPIPVAAINNAAPLSRLRDAIRYPQAPTASVPIAEPSIVVVAITPTSSVPSPIDNRYAGSSTAM